ncbi:hypothetical protein SEA_REINDEER_78 [Mycobacterium phage Reindeer]|uniref:Uncharacterized protein n=1 Tax=Mycobacterium phage Reindeer TaxID=2762283 RepID=A0A7G8LI16_9CAUD|nr:hypothetical protein J4U05_gp078 [Mycobacterium phage Reindeer]QNJ56888.1 hypothetical protein SEA_REINDEER_78 [Mycobacterium phage Reindeer]
MTEDHEIHIHASVGNEVKDRLNRNLKAHTGEDLGNAPEVTVETAEEAARKDKFRRVPNRQMRRDMMRLVGEVKSSRSRIRRRVYRVRKYYEGKS